MSTGRPSVLFNGMIAPLQPFAIRGVAWYQGEGNASRAYQYQALLDGADQGLARRPGRGGLLLPRRATGPVHEDRDRAGRGRLGRPPRGADLPASPSRADDFPMTTRP